MLVETEFKNLLSEEKKFTLEEMKEIAEEYKQKLYDYRQKNGEPYAPNSINAKFSILNNLVKKYYPEYHVEIQKIFIPDRDVKKKQIKNERSRIWKRLRNLVFIDYNKYMKIISDNKDTEDFWTLCCVLLLSSGRRSTELFKSKFELIKGDKQNINVSNVLKKKNEDDRKKKYKIPLIGLSPKEFIEKIEILRVNSEFEDMDNKKVAHDTNTQINSNLRELFDDKRITSEVVRSAYGSICYELFADENDSILTYTATVLAHFEDVETVARNYSYIKIKNLENRFKTEKKEKVKKKLHDVIDEEFTGMGLEDILSRFYLQKRKNDFEKIKKRNKNE
jgi:hypothetical protein